MANPLPTFQLPYRIDKSDPNFHEKIQSNFDRLAMFIRQVTGKAEVIGDFDEGDIEDISGWAKDAYDGTVAYRTSGPPTNDPEPTGIQVAKAPNGTMLTTLSWAKYTQGAIAADYLIIFMVYSSEVLTPLGAPTVNNPSTALAVNTSDAAQYTIPGLNPSYMWSFGIAAARKSENGLEIGPIQTPSMWLDKTIGTPDFVGTVDGITPETLDLVISNFNGRNDRIGVTPANPVVNNMGDALKHILNDDGTCDIAFEWGYTGAGDSYDVDGFLVYVRSSDNNSPYTFGTTPSEEQSFYVKPAGRIFYLHGVAVNRYYTFGVQAYRDVDQDIHISGRVQSSISKTSYAGQNPYRPQEMPDFKGTINGISVEDITGGIGEGSILQAWQETLQGNFDNSAPLSMYCYIPDDVKTLKKAILRFKLMEYRRSTDTGIILEDVPEDVTVTINNDDVTDDLGGPFDEGQDDLDITEYINIGEWNVLEFSSPDPGRISASVYIKALVGTA